MQKIKNYLKDPSNLAMSLSVAAALIMLVGKISAYLITQSAAIFSDAMESIVHLFAISVATFSLWYSKRPPDHDHQYGHGKIAYFSAAAEALLILGAALGIIYMAIDSLVNGVTLNDLDIGLIILTVLTLINFLLGTFLVWTGKKQNAFILIANGKHVLTDMWTSLGVIVGITIVWLTNITWLDPVVAILVACNIIWTAFSLLKTSFQGLMEKVDENTHSIIHTVLKDATTKKQILAFHQLRHRRINDSLWIDVHLLFEKDATIEEVHEKASKIEMEVIECFPKDHVHVTTHLEPENHMIAHPKGHPEYHKRVETNNSPPTNVKT